MCLLRREVLPLSRRGVNGFSPGGEALPQSGPLTAPGLVPLHLKKRGLQNDSMCFILAHSPAQTRWTLCSCLQTHTRCSSSQKIEEEKKKASRMQVSAHASTHTRTHTALPLHRTDHDDRGGRSNSLVLHRVRISHMQIGIVHGE